MSETGRRGTGWLEPALEVISRRYFGPGTPGTRWTPERWLRATGAALAERLGPALGEASATIGVDVPRRSWALLAAARLENERRTESQARMLSELGPAFRKAEVRPVLFKGLALARHYPAIASRATGDIDLLVAPDDLPRAERVLHAFGFECWSGDGPRSTGYAVGYSRYGDGEETAVDLHPAWHEVSLDPDAEHVVVGELRAPLAAGDIGAGHWSLLPAPVELYLTAAHAVLHAPRTLSAYLDLAVLLAVVEEDAIRLAAELAKAQGRERHLKHMLTAAAELFGLEVDIAYRTLARRLGVPVGWRLGYAGTGFRLLPSSLVMELALRRGLRRKLAFARWVLGHRSTTDSSLPAAGPRGRLRRAIRGLRWFKGTVLRYRVAGATPLRP